MYNSLAIAQIDNPAPDERMAVFEMSELPGRASTIDWAFFLGSSAGTVEALRLELRAVKAGRVRMGSVGRSLAAPASGQQTSIEGSQDI